MKILSQPTPSNVIELAGRRPQRGKRASCRPSGDTAIFRAIGAEFSLHGERIRRIADEHRALWALPLAAVAEAASRRFERLAGIERNEEGDDHGA